MLALSIWTGLLISDALISFGSSSIIPTACYDHDELILLYNDNNFLKELDP